MMRVLMVGLLWYVGELTSAGDMVDAAVQMTFEPNKGNNDDICVTSCEGLDDGHYQSCTGCKVYTTCSDGVLYARCCPDGFIWDDIQKRCDVVSTTCLPPNCTTGGTCISSCDDKADGHYQSCTKCDGYVSCTHGLYQDRPCVATLVWDDNKKECRGSSSTCTSCED